MNFYKLINSFKYALQGIESLLRSEQNMILHVIAAIVVIAAGLYFKITIVEWCLITLAIGFVLVAEAMNTAIEALTDHVQPEQHPLAGKVKDISAGAVLLAAICALMIGGLVFFKYIF